MCDCEGMWEGHTADLFEEITEREALSDSPYIMMEEAYRSGMFKAFSKIKPVQSSSELFGKKEKIIKFRRYAPIKDQITDWEDNIKVYGTGGENEKEMVRSPKCEPAVTLDASGKVRGVLSRDIPGSAYIKTRAAETYMAETEGSHGNGPSFPEG